MKLKFLLNENFEFENLLLESSYRGDTTLREFICLYLNRVLRNCNLDFRNYIIHHIDTVHSNYNVDNIMLLPTYIDLHNPNTSIHNKLRKGTIIPDVNDDNYVDMLAKYFGIDVYKSIQNGFLSNIQGKDISNVLYK